VGDLSRLTFKTPPPKPEVERIKAPVRSALRLVQWGWVLARHDALIPREANELLPAWGRPFAGFVQAFASRKLRAGRPGQRVGAACEKLGPVAIKLGQVLATRADIFGLQFAQDLGHLKDKLPPFPIDQARTEIERSLGRSADSLYVDFGEAVGAASLAQAHPATMADGTKVAVKILRPGIERKVSQGLDAMRLGAKLVDWAVEPARRLEPRAFVEIIARSLQLELDMRLEAAAASELGEVMAKDGYMTAPKVIWDGVGKRVLTLEWAQGIPMTTCLCWNAMCWLTRWYVPSSFKRWTTASSMPICTKAICSPTEPTRSPPSILVLWVVFARPSVAIWPKSCGALSAAIMTASRASISMPVMYRRTIRWRPLPKPWGPGASR